MTTTEAKVAAAAMTQKTMMTIKQKLQPKTQNNNNMETLTMAAQKTVAIRQLQYDSCNDDQSIVPCRSCHVR
jgi:hypothetical protein